MSYSKIVPDSFTLNCQIRQNAGTDKLKRVWNWNETKSGTRVSGWRTKIRNNENAASAYSVDRQEIRNYQPGSCGWVLKYHDKTKLDAYRHFEGNAFASRSLTGMVPHLVVPSVENEALIRAYQALSSLEKSYDGSTFAAEFMGTVRMFSKPYSAIVDLFNRHVNLVTKRSRGLPNKLGPRKKAYVDILSDTWLETSFGLVPLIADAAGIAEALAKFRDEALNGVSYPQTLKARASRSLTSNQVFPILGGYAIDMWATQKTITTRRAQYIIGLKENLSADGGSVERLVSLLGFRPGDWVPGIYNALPWTWLLDYFANLGDLVECASTSTANVKYIVKTLSTRTQQVNGTFVVPTGPRDSLGVYHNYNSGAGGSFVAVRNTVDRTIPTTLSLPTIQFKHPFDNWKKIANLSAVLIQRRTSLPF